jgi:uncharacterized protein YjiK
MNRVLIVAALLSAVVFGGQKDKPATELGLLARYDLSYKHPTTRTLPRKVSEASGLAVSDDGRLFCHDDERGVVYQINFSTGEIVKQFALGRFGVNGDFEDIAIKGKTFYLIESGGTLYEFPETNDGQTVEYRTYKTFLTQKNDVEGLVYDKETDCLLLLCKGSAGKGYSAYKAVYSFSLKKKSLAEKPRFLVPLDRVTRSSHSGEFNPSGIARHPKSGTFFIIAAQGSTIIELSRDGKILAQQSINRKANPHPEGIAFIPDGTLILCNDGQGSRGSITYYPPQKASEQKPRF